MFGTQTSSAGVGGMTGGSREAAAAAAPVEDGDGLGYSMGRGGRSGRDGAGGYEMVGMASREAA